MNPRFLILSEYPPIANSLHQLCCGLLRYARERVPELDILRDSARLLAISENSIDGEMKRLRAKELPIYKRAEPITYT